MTDRTKALEALKWLDGIERISKCEHYATIRAALTEPQPEIREDSRVRYEGEVHHVIPDAALREAVKSAQAAIKDQHRPPVAGLAVIGKDTLQTLINHALKGQSK